MLREDTSLSAPIVVANHIIDDLLLEEFCRKNSIPLLDLYRGKVDISPMWDKIQDDLPLLERVEREFCRKILALVTQGGLFIGTQYMGLPEKLMNLTTSVECSCTLLQRVRKKLLQNDFLDCEVLLKTIAPEFPGHPFGMDNLIIIKKQRCN